jgi:hypothetical protein
MLGLWLAALHMLGDYILQNNWMAANKFRCWKARTIHVALYTVPFMLFAGAYTRDAGRMAAFALSVFVLHWITDCRRWASAEPWPPKPILVDQTLHALQLAVCGSLFLQA